MELKQYAQLLLKWWWLIAAATLVATASSFVATRRQPPIYRTSATVVVGSAIENPNPRGSDILLTGQLANTYADIAKRATVRNAAMANLGLAWLPEYTVRIVPETQLLEISVTDTDPQRAKAVADELASQLINASPASINQQDAQRQAFINQQLSDLETTIQATKDEISDKQAELANLFSARQIADTQTQIAGLQNKLSAMQANYAALLSNSRQGAVNTVNLVESAELPIKPVGPNRGATVLLAAAIGFLLAAGAAFLLEYLDDTVKNPDDVKADLGLTTLGAVPVIEEAGAGDELTVLASSKSATTEAFRILRTNLQFAGVERPLKLLPITSPAPSEGKSLTAANLGAALATAGRRVIVVDTDLHRPRLHRLFKLRNSLGITTALLEEHPTVEGLLQETGVPGLRLLSSGPLPPNPAELLGSARMRELLAQMEALADIVVLDSPPATALSDAAILATQCDGVLLVLDSGKSRREEARRALEALGRVNARVVGAVLNRMPTRGRGYYYYYNYYSYHYGQNDERSGGRPRRRSWRERLARKSSPSSPAAEAAPSPGGRG